MKILPTIILIISMSIYTQANTNNVIEKNDPNTQKKKEAYPGVEWKPKAKLDKDQNKYPGVEWKPKEGQNKYPGVEWKPTNGDPIIPHENLDTYPGVEWTPKK